MPSSCHRQSQTSATNKTPQNISQTSGYTFCRLVISVFGTWPVHRDLPTRLPGSPQPWSQPVSPMQEGMDLFEFFKCFILFLGS